MSPVFLHRIRFSRKLWLLGLAGSTALVAAEPLTVEIRPHLGRPAVVISGEPVSLAAYSPAGFWNRELFNKQMAHFADRRLNCFFVTLGQADVPGTQDFFAGPLWVGDDITAAPAAAFKLPPDEQAETILRDHPQAFLIVRFGLHEPASWRELHPAELFVDEDAKTLPVPSLASDAYWDAAARHAAAAIEYAEGRPWSGSPPRQWWFCRVSAEPLAEPLPVPGPRVSPRLRPLGRPQPEPSAAVKAKAATSQPRYQKTCSGFANWS